MPWIPRGRDANERDAGNEMTGPFAAACVCYSRPSPSRGAASFVNGTARKITLGVSSETHKRSTEEKAIQGDIGLN